VVFFAFPSSPEDHLRFRDGMRLVPDYVAVMLAGIETENYTYDEAMEIANQQMLGNSINGKMDRVIGDHMREVRRGNR